MGGGATVSDLFDKESKNFFSFVYRRGGGGKWFFFTMNPNLNKSEFFKKNLNLKKNWGGGGGGWSKWIFLYYESKFKQEGHEALNRSPEYIGQKSNI